MKRHIPQLETDRRGALILAGAAVSLPALSNNSAFAAEPDQELFKLGRDQNFNLGWRFFRGEGDGFEKPDANDSQWRKLPLPHDWSIENVPDGKSPEAIGPFAKDAIGGTATGFTVGGEGWYRKHFRLGALPRDARVEVQFDGIYRDSDVWLNGRHLGTGHHGYIPIAYDLTPYLNLKGGNVLAVRVRNQGKNSRWYAGSGMYREVTLDVLPSSSRIARWGVGAWTRRITDAGAEIDVRTALLDAGPGMTLATRLRLPSGQIAAEAASTALEDTTQTLTLASPSLWSPNEPALYQLETELRRGKKVVDRIVQPFGVRIVTMDAKNGLRINGKRHILRGGCIHHDNGLLGACAYGDADERRVRTLKAHGYNAIRSSHNPASRSLRDVCDRNGMLLIEEAFDTWFEEKEPQDFHLYFPDHWEEVLKTMVLSARNSPSVIMWSIGNEIPSRSSDTGVRYAWELANRTRQLDPTRPVTQGLNGMLGGLMVAGAGTAVPGREGQLDRASTIFMDVPGFNYRLGDIEMEHKEFPERVVYASETFPQDAWAYTRLAERAPYMLGEFVWTAMDYIGEAGIGWSEQVKEDGMPIYFPKWPWVNAFCGDIDLIGHQKPQSLARDVIWGVSPVELLVHRHVPKGMREIVSTWGWPAEQAHWNWEVAPETPLDVRVFTRGDRAEIRLDGVTVAEGRRGPDDDPGIRLKVPYRPGRIEAIGYRDGREIGRRSLETTGAPASLRLTQENGSTRVSPNGLAYIRVDIVDAAGRIVPDTALPLSVKVEGAGELLAFGSAGKYAVSSLTSGRGPSWNGRALAIIRATGRSGRAIIAASADGLRGDMTDLHFG